MKKSCKMLLGLVLALALIVTGSLVAFAAGTNLEIKADKTSAEKGQTITITMSNKAMTVSSVGGGINFDKTKLKALTIEGTSGKNKKVAMFNEDDEVTVTATACSTVEEANESGRIGFAFAGTDDVAFSAGLLFTATFEVLAKGNVTLTMYEDSAGTNGFKSDEAASLALTLTEPKQALAGTVTVTGDAVIGQTLTADVSALNDSTNVTYQWKRDGSAIAGATKNTYTLAAADYNKKISVTVTATAASEFAGSVTSNATAAVAKQEGPAAPEALTEDKLTVGDTTIKVTTPDAALEYALVAKGAAVTAADFKGATEFKTDVNTEYDLYVRVKETATAKASAASAALTVKTGDHVPGNDWKFDKENHWKECAVEGCGTLIESTKAAHTFENKVCTVCGAKAEEEAPETGDGAMAVALVIAALLMACAAAVVVINKKDFE